MTLLLFVALSFVLGLLAARWSVVGLPPGLGFCAAMLLVATGHDISDTPIAFVSTLATFAAAGGVITSRRRPAAH